MSRLAARCRSRKTLAGAKAASHASTVDKSGVANLLPSHHGLVRPTKHAEGGLRFGATDLVNARRRVARKNLRIRAPPGPQR